MLSVLYNMTLNIKVHFVSVAFNSSLIVSLLLFAFQNYSVAMLFSFLLSFQKIAKNVEDYKHS